VSPVDTTVHPCWILLQPRASSNTEQLPHVATNPKHHLPAPVPHPEPTGGDPRRGTPPPPRGQPPSQPSPAKLSLPLESPASARAKPPSLGPRTGPPAASRRQASPAAGSSPSLGRFATPSGRDAVSPPLSLASGPTAAPSPSQPRRLPLALGPPLGRKRFSARARARCGPKAVSPAQERGILFSFSFSTPFSHLNSFPNILCTKNYQKGFSKVTYNNVVRK
jgi:hypothetical protein